MKNGEKSTGSAHNLGNTVLTSEKRLSSDLDQDEASCPVDSRGWPTRELSKCDYSESTAFLGCVLLWEELWSINYIDKI